MSKSNIKSDLESELSKVAIELGLLSDSVMKVERAISSVIEAVHYLTDCSDSSETEKSLLKQIESLKDQKNKLQQHIYRHDAWLDDLQNEYIQNFGEDALNKFFS